MRLVPRHIAHCTIASSTSMVTRQVGLTIRLVEAMHFGKPVLAVDCKYNRCTIEDKGFFFKNSEDLVRLMETMDVAEARRVGDDMLEIAERRYTWRIVAQQYFALIDVGVQESN